MLALDFVELCKREKVNTVSIVGLLTSGKPSKSLNFSDFSHVLSVIPLLIPISSEHLLIPLLWMQEILHQLVDGLTQDLSGFNHPFGGARFRNHPQYVPMFSHWYPISCCVLKKPPSQKSGLPPCARVRAGHTSKVRQLSMPKRPSAGNHWKQKLPRWMESVAPCN